MKIEIEIGENLLQLLKGRDSDTVCQTIKDIFENIDKMDDKNDYKFFDMRKNVDGIKVKIKRCKICGRKMTPVYKGIGGFPGHPHIHPTGEVDHWECPHCENESY